MSQLGIKVDESITQGDPELLFASSYIVECDIDEIDEWCIGLANKCGEHTARTWQPTKSQIRCSLERYLSRMSEMFRRYL